MLDRPYGEQVALWLNLPRVQLRRAAAVALGVGFGTHGVSREWADALAPTDAEADELFLEMRAAAKEARARGRGA